MKKCPYCAEEIQDEAIRCRFCGSDLTVPPPQRVAGLAAGPPPAPHVPSTAGERVVGEGALAFSHSGYRYVLGWGADHFGIWDRNVAGGPVATFPRTNEGWAEAWNRFAAWEPRNVEVPRGGGTPPDVRATTGTHRPAATRARWAAALLALAALLAVVGIGLQAAHIGALRGLEDGVVPLSDVRASEDRLAALEVAGGAVMLGAAVTWLLWQHRAHSNLRPLGASGLRFTPAWAVGWWFVPFANLVMPYLTMDELWRASHPRTGAIEWKAGRGTTLLALWWVAWLGSTVLALIGSGVGRADDIPSLVAQHAWFIGSEVVTVGAAALAILLIRGIEGRQEEKRALLAGWSRDLAPAP